MDENARYKFGVIEDGSSISFPDKSTVNARCVWLMDSDTPTLFFDSTALADVQHELSEARDEIANLRKALGVSQAKNQRLNEGLGDVIGDGSYPYGCPDQANMIDAANTAIEEAKAIEESANIIMPETCPDCGTGLLFSDIDDMIEFEECSEHCGYRRKLYQHYSDGSKCSLSQTDDSK